ncbi:Ppx/GppA phosphatase family protein [Ramlibacter tataouinensis]|uniref:Exopolyphosphatase n=1 Tax=Ramlibacter tataouinensis TaxID=94132 RepID=A0A127JYJ5_9BURK|nr:Ppx/GppA phosphatase family protein [Ramlibacter tataouinensis]AMO25011.1 exopolyphosphatase [Ramlibacter tataouinensis]
MKDGTLLAAVDLGSNSFRLEMGRLDHGQVLRVQYLKEPVRLGGGLDDSRNLTAGAMERGWQCLARFAEQLASFGPAQVRAAATQTLREARNRDAFLSRAQEILGHPIDVISGREEARLIYQGVAHLLPQSDEKRLVVDIGGRSTELILGQGYRADVTESFRVGSVAWSMRYFPEGQFTAPAFERAEVAAQAILDGALDIYTRERWEVAYGSSGTIGAVADMLLASSQGQGEITPEGLAWLQRQLLLARSADRLRLPGLKDDRRPVIGGGLSILRAVFSLLGVERMLAASGALRHGLLYDLIDREQAESDVRGATIERLAVRFGVDRKQARRVAQAAGHFLKQLLGSEEARDAARQLTWAAQLHEVGIQVSHSDYHKHGAYILDNTDAAGFSQQELHRLSLLVLGHRGKLRKLDADFDDEFFIQQLLCLRLAVILCHARRDAELRGLQLTRDGRALRLALPQAWGSSYPQSLHLLQQESVAWQKTPWSFTV